MQHDISMAKEVSEKAVYLMLGVLRNPRLWVAAVIVALLAIIHYHEFLENVPVLGWIGSTLGFNLARQTLERILFLIPVAYIAATVGIGGGLSVLVLITAVMFPRVFLISTVPREALFETCGVIFTGFLIVLLFDVLQKARQRLTELETAHKMLDLQVKRLGMLHSMSSIVSQSLELGDVLATTDKVGQLIQTEASWLYLYDEKKRRLKLTTFSGLSKMTLPETLQFDEGLGDVVDQTSQSATIENIMDSGLKLTLLNQGGLRSVLNIPLIAKGDIVGALGVGTRLVHHFSSDEVDLLRATGDQISMAIENARLYERERLVAEALRVSERNYRELFENASDAIWVHDLSGTITAVNSAFEKLTGYDRDTLVGMNVSMLLSSHGLAKVDQESHEAALRGEDVEPYEQTLLRKDNSMVIIQLGTSLITKDKKPWAFQHLARDITEEKRIQENLRFYLQQMGQAQEAERKRIARELHDDTTQALITVSRSLDDLASGNTQVSVADIKTQVRSILQGVRNFSRQLRPSILDDLGLVPAVRWLVSDLTKNNDIAADIEVTGEQRQLSPEAELMIFRIVQEALANVRKHSEANTVSVRVEFADYNTKLIVSDNGKGFEIPARVSDLARNGKLGLIGMQERAQLLGGTLTINSEPGKGTTVVIEVPLSKTT